MTLKTSELVILFTFIAIIGFLNASKFLRARKFFIYHEQASGLSWEQVPAALYPVILAIMRMAGVGMGAVGLLALVMAVAQFLSISAILSFIFLIVVAAYWVGVEIITARVHFATKANTPWKQVLILLGIIVIGSIIYVILP